MAHIRIDDLPALEALRACEKMGGTGLWPVRKWTGGTPVPPIPSQPLSPEEQSRILGAGRPTTQLGLRALEDRQLMAAGITASISDRVLTFTGTSGDDVILVVRHTDGSVRVNNASLNSLLQGMNIPVFGDQIKKYNVNQIHVNGLDGNDNIDLTGVGTLFFSRLNGGDGNDTLTGGSGIDTLEGRADADTLRTGTRDGDTLYGVGKEDRVKQVWDIRDIPAPVIRK